MYIVFIAGSIPTLKPLFRKQFSTYHPNRHDARYHGDDVISLASTPVPSGRAKIPENAAGVDDDDKTEENFMGTGLVPAATTAEEFETFAF